MVKFVFIAVLVLTVIEKADAEVRINEFVASNDTGLVDEDGDHSDWIELHNTGGTVDLGGWYLTDSENEPTQWLLPSVELPADGYLIIYASGKDRTSGAFLHANFKLGRGGEFLALIEPDGETIADAYQPEYPEQITDISYGVASSNDIGFLATATPGTANSGLLLPALDISPASQTFTGPFTVTLAPTSPLVAGDAIYYTMDGSAPSTDSLVYSGPFELNSGADIRAAVWREGESSLVSSASYISYGADLIGFESSLPLVVIDTRSNAVSTDEVAYTTSSIAVLDLEAGTGKSSLADSLEHLGYAGIRIRGSSSSTFPKKPYKVEFWNSNLDDMDVDILGLGAESDFVLIAPGYQDRNMIPNPFMSDLTRDLGLLDMEWRYVEVFLNDDNGVVEASDYDGVYLLFENIKTGAQRVDIPKLDSSDTSESAISGGYIVKFDRKDADEYAFKPNPAFNSDRDSNFQMVVHRPKIDDLTTVQQSWIESYVRELEAALLSDDPLNAETGYRNYIEEASWIDAHLLDLLALDADLLRLSNYFYKDRDYRLVNAPLWDFDRSMNSTDIRDDEPGELVSPWQVDPFEYSWWGALFDIPHFEEKYKRRWHALRKGPLSAAALSARIAEVAAPLFEPYDREIDRWVSESSYGSRYGNEYNLQGELDALENWLNLRLTFLDDYLADPGTAACNSSTMDYSLVAATWAMLSLPCVPPAGSTLESVFSDDISGDYGTDWTVFVFDPTLGTGGGYVELNGGQLPAPGQGFWLIQISEPVAILDLPDDSTPVQSSAGATGCPGSSGCASIPVSELPRWMMLGNPTRAAVPLKELRVTGASGPCSGSEGCSLQDAVEADVLPSPFFTYIRDRSTRYLSISREGMLNEWTAFWAFGGANAGLTMHSLVIPADSP